MDKDDADKWMNAYSKINKVTMSDVRQCPSIFSFKRTIKQILSSDY